MDSIQAIIDLYKKDVDVTLLEENLKKTVEERISIPSILRGVSRRTSCGNCERGEAEAGEHEKAK